MKYALLKCFLVLVLVNKKYCRTLKNCTGVSFGGHAIHFGPSNLEKSGCFKDFMISSLILHALFWDHLEECALYSG